MDREGADEKRRIVAHYADHSQRGFRVRGLRAREGISIEGDLCLAARGTLGRSLVRTFRRSKAIRGPPARPQTRKLGCFSKTEETTGSFGDLGKRGGGVKHCNLK